VKTRVLVDQLGPKLTETLGLRTDNQRRRAARSQ
jgi:hypothetical protein